MTVRFAPPDPVAAPGLIERSGLSGQLKVINAAIGRIWYEDNSDGDWSVPVAVVHV